jgi:hypothetical protein
LRLAGHATALSVALATALEEIRRTSDTNDHSSPMFRFESMAALRAALPLPVALSVASLAVAQAPDAAGVSLASETLHEDVKTYTPSLTPAQLAAIEAQDAADRAQSLPLPAPAADATRSLDVVPAIGHLRRAPEVLLDATAVPGTVWGGGSDWKAEFAPRGVTYFPRVGRSAASAPTSFELARVTRGGDALSFRNASVRTEGQSVVMDRGTLREVYHLGLETLEQTFVFDTLVGEGDLVLDVAVASAWEPMSGEELIRFVGPVGEVTYGRAFVFDASGARQEIERTWTGEGIRLTVPAAFLAGAVLPLTVDPVIVATVTNVLDDDESNPDVVYDSNSSRYWIAYQDYFSATDSDVWVIPMTPGGTFGTSLAIDFTGDSWVQPAVAVSPASGNMLVVASTTPDGPGSANADIEGRFVDTTTLALSGAQFLIDETSLSCVKPDVGGSTWTGAPFADYCVVWEREFNPTDHDILARVVNQDGTFLTSTIFLSNSGSNDDYAPAISKSRGDESFNGDFWNIAWIRDANQDGLGTPLLAPHLLRRHAERRDGAGRVQHGAGEQRVDVTSSFDTTVPGLGERPFIVVFDRDVNNGDIYATVCTQLGALTDLQRLADGGLRPVAHRSQPQRRDGRDELLPGLRRAVVGRWHGLDRLRHLRTLGQHRLRAERRLRGAVGAAPALAVLVGPATPLRDLVPVRRRRLGGRCGRRLGEP